MVYAGRILPKSRSHRPEFRSIWLCFRSVNRTVNRKKKPFKSDDAVLIRIRKKNGMCISMELVTAVLGDHGQRPLDDYGFFVDINLFKSNKGRDPIALKSNDNAVKDASENSGQQGKDGLADNVANLMIKLKFLTYKLRTFLVRNGLSILFKEGPAAYKAYYLRSANIKRKCGNKQLSSSIYLSEAEPFLEQYVKRSSKNQVLIGSAGNLVRSEDFLALVDGYLDEEGDLVKKEEVTPATPEPAVKEAVYEGLIVFFPGKYWPKVADERRKKPQSIMLADKNAPNEDVWRRIEDVCRRTRTSAVPVVPDSEGTESNPYSLDALAVFMFRVLQ
uniref:Uncharacterized protein n=1 Tax=Brassica campestris TaxID=3711 RepID=M4EUD7_BRACM